MEDLQEEADRLFDDIRKGESFAIRNHFGAFGASDIRRFLDLMDKRRDDGSNMLIFAITNRNYECARIILEILKLHVEEDRSSTILLARDNEGNDCLRILMLSRVKPVTQTTRLDNLQFTSDEPQREKEDIDNLFHLLLQFTDAIQQLAIGEEGPTGEGPTAEEGPTGEEGPAGEEGPTGEEGRTGEKRSLKETGAKGEDAPTRKKGKWGNGAIFWAVKNKLGDYAEKLLRVLPVDIQLKVIKQTEECTMSDHSNGLYNLLMLSFGVLVQERLADTIIGIVCAHDDQGYKSEVVMGKDKPEAFSQSENCLRLAASNRNEKHLVRLFKECVPENRQFKALLEVGPCGNSAMSLLLKADDIETLKELLGKRERVQSMREALYDPATRSSFMQLQMTPQAIEFFHEMMLFRYNFFIPKPSGLSKPFAIMCHGRDSEKIKRAETLNKALLKIGWHKNSVKLFDHPFDVESFMEEIASNCSFLLLYFTYEPPCFMERMIHIIRRSLPKFVPKAIIRDDDPQFLQYAKSKVDTSLDFQSILARHNILLLLTDLSGKVLPSHNFVPELAEQIKAADGKTSLQDMFTAAVNNSCGKSESTESVTSHIESPYERIVLRRYDGKENLCRSCEKDIRSCSQRCMICSTCHKWYHLTCLDIEEGLLELCRNPWFNWLCETCYDKEMKE